MIDPILKFPSIDSASITPVVFDTNSVHIQAYAHVVSEEPIQRVSVQAVNPKDSIVANITLSNSGNNRYTGNIDFVMDCRLLGQYNVQFLALNNSNLYSNIYPVSFNVINSHNHKPFIVGLICPDSLQLPSGIGADTIRSAFLQLHVNDTDGICDVRQAFFNSFKPDGNPSTGNPFFMYDDGDPTPPHCDTTAGDGKFSLCIYLILRANPQIGNYTFKFNAKDQSLLLSDTLVHHIYVHQ